MRAKAKGENKAFKLQKYIYKSVFGYSNGKMVILGEIVCVCE